MVSEPRRSPLHHLHVAAGARLTAFGSWDMPLSYPTGTVAEHLACRRGAAVFDVSHLGTVRLRGADAAGRVQRAFTNDLGRIGPGRAQYTHLLDAAGDVADDCIVWWVDDHRLDVMPNASNTERVRDIVGGEDVTEERAILAVQGPAARSRLAEVAPAAAAVGRFAVAEVDGPGSTATVAGTGYTGEDGVEIAVPAGHAPRWWAELVDAGCVPAGLGARDTLRLEAGFPLHGAELGPGIDPLTAGLGWVVAWDKPEGFVGRAALARRRDVGLTHRLVGLAVAGRRPPRAGAEVVSGGATVGRVTSGNFSPVLGHGIAMAFVDGTAGLDLDREVEVLVRGRALPARVVPRPFVTPGPPEPVPSIAPIPTPPTPPTPSTPRTP